MFVTGIASFRHFTLSCQSLHVLTLSPICCSPQSVTHIRYSAR